MDEIPSKTIEVSKNQTTNIKENVHLVNLEYDLCVVYKYKTHSFLSQQNEQIFTIFHEVKNYKSNFLIYLLECIKCQIQIAGKAETDFTLRLNNHSKDINKADAILGFHHFPVKDHILNSDGSFAIIQWLHKSSLSRGTMKELLKQSKHFWIMKSPQSRTKKIRGQVNGLPSYATFSFVQCILANPIHRCFTTT